MRILPGLLLVPAFAAGLADGAIKLTEAPRMVAVFHAGGIAPEVLGLYGAVQFFAALLLVIPRTRRAAGVVLAAGFGSSAWLMRLGGETPFAALSVAAAILVLAAVFWPRGPRAPRAYSLPILGPRR